MISHEIKSQLAKLLATEDLVVENKYVETAQFNVHTRVLTLPVWEKASSQVYDMLVAHEVGHALYTPDNDWFRHRKISPQFVNIVEDVRIEKMMKRRYAGIAKTFHRGYQELAEDDFFCIENEDVDKMNLADKANLYFKIGKFVDITFDRRESVLIQKIGAAETFDDVLDVAEELYNFCKQQQAMKTKTDDLQVQGGQEGGEGQSETDSEEDDAPSVPNGTNEVPQPQESDSGDFDSEEPEENGSYGGTHNDEEPEVTTAQSLEDALKELASNEGWENVYLELPKLEIDEIIIPNKEIHARFDEWNEFLEVNKVTEDQIFGVVDKEFQAFKKSAQKEVNYLVKEFECRKAADSYARATTARTGVLDCSKLHTYKYNEDLFKKVTTLAEGKNHGLVFVLDWSGSMGNVLQDTLKQLFNLMWFCKKASIPFEVYAFTNEYPREYYEEDEIMGKTQKVAYQKREGLIAVGPWFSMMNIFTSNTKMKELEEQMKNFYRLSYNMTRWSNAPIPTGLGLSGTPLNEAFISLHQILPQFKKQYKVQKVQCVVLTDGEAGGMKYHREVQRRWEEGPFLGIGSVQQNAFLRNRKTGNTYSFDCEWWQMSDIFLKDLRDTFSDVNFIGIRVLESRDAGSFIRRYTGWTPKFEKVQKVWKKERAFALHDAGYHTYFGLSAAALSNESEFDVDEGASKAKIKSAFVKSLKNKKMNKKVLGEFIELIA